MTPLDEAKITNQYMLQQKVKLNTDPQYCKRFQLHSIKSVKNIVFLLFKHFLFKNTMI